MHVAVAAARCLELLQLETTELEVLSEPTTSVCNIDK